LTVRYLTRRFIGEYRSNTDLLYKQTVTLESGLLDVEIIDVSVDDDDGFPIDQIQWADAVLIVYSITDRESFNYALRSLGEIRQIQNGPATYLVANKADLDHLREVRTFFWTLDFLMGRNCVNDNRGALLFIFHSPFDWSRAIDLIDSKAALAANGNFPYAALMRCMHEAI
jgi:Ras family